MNDTIRTALAMIVKDEEKRINVTLKSVLGHVCAMVIVDTGSTDNTIHIIKKFCKKRHVTLHLKEIPFVDFATTRNAMLDFADSLLDIDYLILLDSNDELRHGQELQRAVITYPDVTCFYVSQMWWSGTMIRYHNTRFIKTRSGWYYEYPVHEYLKNNEDGKRIVKLDGDLVIFQDRTKDDDKSYKRFSRDKLLLSALHKKSPDDPRCLFYLGQTYRCLNDPPNSFYYYRLRTTMGGYIEEVFESYLQMGHLSQMMQHEWHSSLGHYLNAYTTIKRAEPLYFICLYYKTLQQYDLAFSFIAIACSLPYPDDCHLFVSNEIYEYHRWLEASVVSYYHGKYVEGKIYSLKAIENARSDSERKLCESNLKFYTDKLSEINK